MKFNEYQAATRETAIYPGAGKGGPSAITYTTLGLTNEAGEVAGKWKKVIRDSNGAMNFEKEQEIAAELGDVLWYLARLADELGTSLEAIAQNNLDKLQSRKERGVIGGSGDNR